MTDLPVNVRRAVEAAKAWAIKYEDPGKVSKIVRAVDGEEASYGYACGYLARDGEVEDLKRGYQQITERTLTEISRAVAAESRCEELERERDDLKRRVDALAKLVRAAYDEGANDEGRTGRDWSWSDASCELEELTR